MVEIQHESHQLAILVDGDEPLPCHWSQTRVTTARVNELWCNAPAVAVLDGIACCQTHLPGEDFVVAVIGVQTRRDAEAVAS